VNKLSHKKEYIKVETFDELCACGHLKSEHHDSIGVLSGDWNSGHGACKIEGCDCKKFKWISFVAKPVEEDEE
jgi:hypothetical protein